MNHQTEYSVPLQSSNHSFFCQVIHLHKMHDIQENIRIPFQAGLRFQETLPEQDEQPFHTSQVNQEPFLLH